MLNQLQDVYSSLNKHQVKYVTIGGIAAILHGVPREVMNYQGQEFYVLSRDDLIASKRAAGRQKDLEDARLLELGNVDS